MGYVAYWRTFMNMKNTENQTEKFCGTFLYTFPEVISFESASGYLNRLNNIDFSADLFFDLSHTREIHSSFVGFLLDLKHNTETGGGSFRLKLSPALDHLFFQLDLHEHFTANAC